LVSVLDISLSLIGKSSSFKFVEFSNFDNFCFNSKTRKQTYREYKKSLLNQLETLHSDNPKLYWNLINELKESKSCDEKSSAVDSSAWVSHFRNLSEIDE
jgi:hypothetical protein